MGARKKLNSSYFLGSLMSAGAVGDWESDSITYPAVFDHGGQRYMLYNGNGYGRTGFGIAILETRD